MDKLKRNRDFLHPNKLLQKWSFFHNRHDFFTVFHFALCTDNSTCFKCLTVCNDLVHI